MGPQLDDAWGQAVLHGAPDAVVGVDARGCVVAWNAAAERLFGVGAAAATGRSFHELGLVDELPAAGTRTEVVARRADGSTVVLDLAVGGAPGGGRVAFVRDVTAERRREQQQRYLAEASAVLGSGLDQDATLQRIAELAVPQLADWCLVYLAEEDGGVRRVTISGVGEADDPVAAAAATTDTHPDIDPDADAGVARVIRTGVPLLRRHTSPAEISADTKDPAAQVELVRPLELRSWICAPLTARGVTFGALSLITARSGRTYGEEDLEFAVQLAHRAALALDNARLYGHQHATAEELQRSLLPERLPAGPGVQLAARYLPGSPGAAVGGDWYDALRLGSSAVVLAIGDVAGRGVRAAAIMGQLRTALRAYLLEGHAPEVAMTRLNRFLEGLGTAEIATSMCLVYDAVAGDLRLAGAGHPPALVVEADGTTRWVRGTPAAPLGVGEVRYRGDEDVLGDGATVLLYTDGLVERRGESLSTGLDRLAAAAAGRADDPELLCDHLIAELVADRSRPDDVAIIALRVVPPGDEAHLRLDAEPASVSEARHAVAGLLEAGGLRARHVHDLSLATSEAVAAAVEHAAGGHPDEVVVGARLDAGTVEVRVRDFAGGVRPSGGPSGLGLRIIEHVVDEVDIARLPSGTVVTMRKRLP